MAASDQRNRCAKRVGRKRGRVVFSPKPVRPAFNRHTASSVRLTADCKLRIDLPCYLDFNENYETTASHFAVLRQAVFQNKPIKGLLFDNIRNISPSAALVLASEVDRWNQMVKGAIERTC